MIGWGSRTAASGASSGRWWARAGGLLVVAELGNAIETGSGLERSVFQQTFGPGEQVPNYTLHPPEGLNIAGKPVTVSEPTQLSELLQPNMGACSWAACLSKAGHPLEGAWMGLLP
ncbi:MAG: putative adhesin [Acidimicrobiales bacterium]